MNPDAVDDALVATIRVLVRLAVIAGAVALVVFRPLFAVPVGLVVAMFLGFYRYYNGGLR